MSDAVWIVAVALYFLINIWGTWAYLQLHKALTRGVNHTTSARRLDGSAVNIGLVSVLLGWSGLPPVNLYNIIVWNDVKHHRHSE
jgi:hypothetical protein